MHWRQIVWRIGAFVLLTMAMVILLSLGSTWLGPQMADSLSPQQASFAGVALLMVCAVDTLLFGIFILNARLNGWRLMAITALIYYLVKSFQANIEALYFMNNLTPDLIPRLFAMTAPVALGWPPLAVWLLGKLHADDAEATNDSSLPPMSTWSWIWKQGLLGLILYPLLFFGFGYFVAWQHPEVRAFYGGGEPVGFLPHMRNLLGSDASTLLFELLRGLLWAGIAALFLWTLRYRPWLAPLLLALVFALVENDTHLFPNPLMPSLVRQVHFVETSSSNLIFGLIAAAVLIWPPRERARQRTEAPPT